MMKKGLESNPTKSKQSQNSIRKPERSLKLSLQQEQKSLKGVSKINMTTEEDDDESDKMLCRGFLT